MSNHLRHCPKHRKRLPCAHCALTAKPTQAPPSVAVAVMDPEPTPTVKPVQVPPITIIPPHAADAKPVPQSAIPPDIRKKITESLSSKPNVISDQRTTILVVDTSEGTKTVKATDDVDSAVDDAAEKIVRETEKKTADRLAKPVEKKQPAYIKSVAHPVVPSADPEAPYGRDKNDKPILPGRSDQQILNDLLGKEFLAHRDVELCEHKADRKYCLLCGTTNFKTVPVEPMDLEEQLRSLFGLTATTVSTSGPTERKKFAYYPEILGITRGQLIGLLNLTIGIEPQAIKKKVLKSKSAITSKIAELERASARISELKQLIAKSEKLIESWSVHNMKLQVKRGERQPEDILDKPTREKFKREKKKNIEKYEQEKSDLQKLLRETDIEQLKQRAASWGSSPDDFELVSTTENASIKFRDKFVYRDATSTHDIDNNIAVLDSYIAFLNQYDLLKDVSRRLRQFPELDVWRYFENEIVLRAIGYGLYRPTKQTFAEYPQLTKYLNGAPVDDSEQDDPENKLILKTGGAQIGGSIYSAGHRNGHQRPLESFDKHRPSGGPGKPLEYGGERPDNFYSDIDSGDLSERSGDE
jgi:hypothetical protein